MPVYNIQVEVDSTGAVKGIRTMTSAQEKNARVSKKQAQNIANLQARLRTAGTVAKTFGIIFAGMFVRSSLRRAAEQEKILKTLEGTIRATGGAAGFSTEELSRYSNQLQELTGIGNTEIEKFMAILLTFKGVQGDVFERATEVALDMSAVLGQDLRSSAIQLGKALEDPKTGLTALRRVGVSFTEQQKEQIETLIESGETMKAQGLILDALEGQLGGAAIAARDSLGGALQALGNEFEDFQKMLVSAGGGGSAIRVVVESWIRGFQAIEKNFGGFVAFVQRGVGMIVGFLAKGFEFIDKFQKGFVSVLNLLPGVEIEASSALANIQDTLELVSEGMEISANETEEAWLDSLTGVAKGAKETGAVIENMVDPEKVKKNAEDAAKAALDIYQKALKDAKAIAEVEGDFLAGQIPLEELPVPEFDPKKEAAELADATEVEFGKIDWSIFGTIFGEGAAATFAGLAGSIFAQILSGDVDAESLGAQIGGTAGAAIGTAFGGPLGSAIGGAIGSALGGLVGGLFGGGPDTVGALDVSGVGASAGAGLGDEALGDSINAVNTLFDLLNEQIGGVVQLTQSFSAVLDEDGKTVLNFFDEFGNKISEISFDDFEEAVRTGLEQVLSTAIVQSGSELTAAFQEVFAQATERGLEQTKADISILTQIGDRISTATGEFDALADAALQDLQLLEQQIDDMALSAEVAGPLLERVGDAIEQRFNQLQTDALDKLFSFFEGTTKFEEERFALAQAQVKIEFALLEAQLKALDLWTKAIQEIFDEARQLELDLAGALGGDGLQISDVRIVEDITDAGDEGLAERNRRRAEGREQFDLLRGAISPIEVEIANLREEFANLGGAFGTNVLEPWIELIEEQRALDIRGTLLSFVRDNEEWSDEFKEFERLKIQAEFARIKLDLQAIGAWEELAELWGAAQEAAFDALDESLDTLGDTVDEFARAIEQLKAFRQSLFLGPDSPITDRERLGLAQGIVADLAAAALGGDAAAAAALPAAIQDVIDIAGGLFGSGAQFQDIFADMVELIDAVIGQGATGAMLPPGDQAIVRELETVDTSIRTQTDVLVSGFEVLRREQEKQNATLRQVSSGISELGADARVNRELV